MSVAHIYPLSFPISVPFYRYSKLLKATRKGKKSKEEFGVTSGNQTRTLLHRRPCNNLLSANPCSMLYSLQKSRTSCFVILIMTIAVAKSEHFIYHVVFLDVSAHGNVQLVGN